jgi:hypothetical protein
MERRWNFAGEEESEECKTWAEKEAQSSTRSSNKVPDFHHSRSEEKSLTVKEWARVPVQDAADVKWARVPVQDAADVKWARVPV